MRPPRHGICRLAADSRTSIRRFSSSIGLSPSKPVATTGRTDASDRRRAARGSGAARLSKFQSKGSSLSSSCARSKIGAAAVARSRSARHPRASKHAGQGRRGRQDRSAVRKQGGRNDHLPVRSDGNSTATTTPTSSDTPKASRKATRSGKGRSSATSAPLEMPPKTPPPAFRDIQADRRQALVGRHPHRSLRYSSLRRFQPFGEPHPSKLVQERSLEALALRYGGARSCPDAYDSEWLPLVREWARRPGAVGRSTPIQIHLSGVVRTRYEMRGGPAIPRRPGRSSLRGKRRPPRPFRILEVPLQANAAEVLHLAAVPTLRLGTPPLGHGR